VNARERWQALQARLTAAQAFESAGDRRNALKEIDAALQLDPDFLAAHSLRERLLTEAPIRPPAPNDIQPARAEGCARFEQRARRRRVDRKIESARDAIARRRLKEAAAALDEIIGIDPNLPELLPLTAEFDDMRRGSADRHRGPVLVAAASFAAIVLGATWLEHARPTTLLARSTTTLAPLVETAAPIAVEAAEPVATDAPAYVAPPPAPEPVAPIPTATSGVRDSEPPTAEPPPVTRPAEPAPEARMAVAPALSEIAIATVPPVIPPVPQPLAASNPPPAAVAPAAVVRPANDDQLVRQALQRYRTAYEGLDAPSARAVYPAVNEAALARAFDGLESQTLTFDACDVQMRGDAATATCRGSARYVPKVGSREPRTEPRTWTFALRRAGADWTIESARAGR
jgi:hypothetical protein